MDYKQKYLKYKQKYLDLKQQIGGDISTCNIDESLLNNFLKFAQDFKITTDAISYIISLCNKNKSAYNILDTKSWDPNYPYDDTKLSIIRTGLRIMNDVEKDMFFNGIAVIAEKCHPKECDSKNFNNFTLKGDYNLFVKHFDNKIENCKDINVAFINEFIKYYKKHLDITVLDIRKIINMLCKIYKNHFIDQFFTENKVLTIDTGSLLNSVIFKDIKSKLEKKQIDKTEKENIFKSFVQDLFILVLQCNNIICETHMEEITKFKEIHSTEYTDYLEQFMEKFMPPEPNE